MQDGRAAELIFNGRFQEAFDSLRSKPLPSAFERALHAWAQLELGEPEKAYSAAQAVAREATDPRTRAFALLAAGKAYSRFGPPEQGLALARRALTLIADLDENLEAEFLAQVVNGVFWIGIEPAVAELPRLRQLALRTGNRNALVEYHLAQARVAAFRNLHQVASTEIRVAEDLLSGHENLDQLWRLRELQANFAVMDSNLTLAREHAEECLRMAHEIGARNRVAYTIGNLANICAGAGDFARARELIVECNGALPTLSQGRLATLSTGVQIGIATGDHEFSARFAAAGLATLAQMGSQQSYYRLWFELHRGRWLLSLERPAEALEVTAEALQSVPALADRELGERFKLLEAEAQAVSGDRSGASKLFGKVCATVRNPGLELLSELMRVAAVLMAPTEFDEAARQLRAGHVLLTSAGLLGVRSAIESTAKALGVELGAATNSELNTSLMTRIGNLLRLGRHPAVLGRELIALLRQQKDLKLALVREVRGDIPEVLESIPPVSRQSFGWDDSCAVRLGNEGDVSYWLRGPCPQSTAAQLLLLSISQIVHASLTCQRRHSSDSSDSGRDPLLELPSTLESGMIVSAQQTTELLHTARKLAPSNITVLITGETGTGKELYARVLHDASPRSSKPFIPFNCSAVSREMLDAQLFGYRKGAFTGATDAFPGVIRAAAGGTLFLDEIGEIALDVQPKLLRFLESGEIHPLGEPRPTHVDVRVVAATNADLEKLVDAGEFREDLFYRLNVVRLQVPPLRERREEIPALAQHYLDKCSREFHKTGLRISDETMEYLILYNWAGNVRQLANEVRRMVALAESGAVLMPEHLSQPIASSRRTIPTTGRYLAPTEFVVRVDQPMSAALEHVERSMIRYALRLSGGRLEDAARRLGLSRKGLYLKRQRFGLSEAEGETRPVADVAESAPAAQQPPADRP